MITKKEQRIIAAMRNTKTSTEMLEFLTKENLKGSEKSFVESLQMFSRLSPKQMQWLRKIYTRYSN